MASGAPSAGGPASIDPLDQSETAASSIAASENPDASPLILTADSTSACLDVSTSAAAEESASSEDTSASTAATSASTALSSEETSEATAATTSSASTVSSSSSSKATGRSTSEEPDADVAAHSNSNNDPVATRGGGGGGGEPIDTSDAFVVREGKDGVVVIEKSAGETSTDDVDDERSVYQIKWTKVDSSSSSTSLAIVTQNENGPCPLLAIVNVLLLRGKLNIPAGTAIITYSQLMSLLWDCILTQTPQHISAGDRLNYEKNMNDALAVIHKLQTGLDVNVKFTGVADFEYTIESIIFDLLNISLYHGWLVDPQSPETEAALGSYSYNQLVERIISNKSSPRPELVTEALIAEEFLEMTKSQLTYHGICELHNSLKEGELAVFFRNNHFSTIYKHKEELFLLVTDQGFVSEPNVMWETLANVEGDSHFVDQHFKTFSPSNAQNLDSTTTTTSASAAASNRSPSSGDSNAAAAGGSAVVTVVDEQKQIDADLLVALSIQDEMDKAEAAGAAGRSSQSHPNPVADGGTNSKAVKNSQEQADRELAMALQQEEERLEAAARQNQGGDADAAAAVQGRRNGGGGATEASRGAVAGGRSSPANSPAGDGDRRSQARRSPGQEKDKDCVIL